MNVLSLNEEKIKPTNSFNKLKLRQKRHSQKFLVWTKEFMDKMPIVKLSPAGKIRWQDYFKKLQR